MTEYTRAQVFALIRAHLADELEPGGLSVLAEQVNLMPERHQRGGKIGVVDVRAGSAEQVAVENQQAQGFSSLVTASGSWCRLTTLPLPRTHREEQRWPSRPFTRSRAAVC